MIKLSDGENDGLLKSIAETQRADMLMGDSLADAFVQPVDCDLYVLGSLQDQIWPSESSLKYRNAPQMGVVDCLRAFMSHGGLLYAFTSFIYVYILSCVSNYLFCKEICDENINLNVKLGVFSGRPVTCSDVA